MREINQLSDWKFTVPRIGLVDMAPGRVEKAFRTLPELLLLYARNVETKVEAILSGQKDSSPPHRKALELVFSEMISQWLEKKTGHRYRDHVAAIQRVTHREAGRKQLPASGETLRKEIFAKRKGLKESVCPKNRDILHPNIFRSSRDSMRQVALTCAHGSYSATTCS